jgi:3',5'-cyclic AMP phosphodiesterase CpdA
VRIAIVTDSHLAPRAAAFNDNWRAVRAFVAAAAPDLTLHLGDITVDGVKDPADFEHARAISADWPTPIRFLPGNHDIGDNPPGPGVAASEPLRPARLADYRTAFGADHWALDAAAWRLLGLNAQLLGTDTDDEAAQWAWLAATLAEAPDRPTVLFLHKPLFQDSPADERPHQRYVPVAARRRLLGLLSAVPLRAVVSGHVHQSRDRVVDGIRHVWVPSTAFFLPDELQDRIGEKVTGIGMIELGPDRLRFHLVCPDGVTRHSVLDHPVYQKHIEARARLLPAGRPALPHK